MKQNGFPVILAALAAVALPAVTACASVDAPPHAGDAGEGFRVASELCASCHAIGVEGTSPHPQAPPFRHVLSRYDPARLVEDLDRAVSVSHLKMPTFYFGDDHPEDLVAYLKTIQQPGPLR
jgi:mono/diheme cytochrome c family protein